jgi:hypothetical protein
MSFEDNIKNWVVIDNQIKLCNDKIKALRDKKHEVADVLMTQAADGGLRDSVIQITDGKLRFTNTKVQSPLTFRYVEDTLASTIKDPKVCEVIMDRLKANRDVKVVHELHFAGLGGKETICNCY